MLLKDLIKELQKWHKKYGDDIEVDVFHNGLYYPSNEIVLVTMPENRRVIQIVTVPVDWTTHFSDRKENNDEKRATILREEEIPIDPDEGRAR